MTETQITSVVLKILSRDWDPIGVRDVVEGEYDSYADRIVEMLACGEDQFAIGRHLHNLERKTMGLRGNPERCDRVARSLLISYHMQLLCPELQTVVRAELASGNQVAESSVGWPKEDAVFLRLHRVVTTATPKCVERRDAAAPHHWNTELFHHRSGHTVAW